MRAQPTRTMGAKRLSNRDSDKEAYGTGDQIVERVDTHKKRADPDKRNTEHPLL